MNRAFWFFVAGFLGIPAGAARAELAASPGPDPASFNLDRPGQYSVEFQDADTDDNEHPRHALMIFADPLEDSAQVPAAAKSLTYQNPISGGPARIRDPFILRVGDKYYLTGTTSNVGIELWSSDDLLAWNKHEGYLIKNADVPWFQNNLWAPEICERQGKFYLTWNGRVENAARQGVGLAVADRPEGPYKNLTPDKHLALGNDASLFIDDDGKAYLLQTGITICQVDLDNARLLTDQVRVLTPGPERAWDDRINEGPCMIKKNGTYYLFWSATGWGYYVGYAAAKNIWGPYAKNPANPIYGAAKEPWERIANEPLDCPFDEVGHGSPFLGPDGRYWLSCHGYSRRPGPYQNPRLCIDPMNFDEKTGALTAMLTWTAQTVTTPGAPGLSQTNAPQPSPTKAKDQWLFVSFKDPGSGGIWFALSENAYDWTILNDGNPWLTPDKSVGGMRDPFIARGPDGRFHLVWTCGRQKIGYANSTDLVHWSAQKTIPLFADNPNARNTWAPEIYWDDAQRHWLIIWSTTLTDRFPETLGQVENDMNHRIYAATTQDFQTLSEPQLFFDPGYPIIDATIFRNTDRFYLIFKDERVQPLHKQIRLAAGPTLEGPWSGVSEPFTAPWTEGPSALRLDDSVLVYYDAYRGGQHMGAALSPDLKTWTDVTDKLSFPPRLKHGGFLKITADEAQRLRTTTPH